MKDQKHTVAATPELAALLRRYQDHALAENGDHLVVGRAALDIVEALLDAEIVDLQGRELSPQRCAIKGCDASTTDGWVCLPAGWVCPKCSLTPMADWTFGGGHGERS